MVDAARMEAVTELAYATRLSQWNTVGVCPASPVAEWPTSMPSRSSSDSQGCSVHTVRVT